MFFWTWPSSKIRLPPSDATEAEAVVSVVVVVWVDVCGVEVQVARELTGVRRTGPVVAAAACVQQGATINTARAGKVEWGRHETTSIIRGVTIVEDIKATEFISRAGCSAWVVGDGGGVVGGDGSGPVVVIGYAPQITRN